MYGKVTALLLLAAIVLAEARNIHVVNNCDRTLFAAWADQSSQGGGGQLDAGQSLDFGVDDGWTGGRVWARTGCDDGGSNCATGDCGGMQCSAYGARGVGLAEFGLRKYDDLDFYDVSFVDGFNVPVTIQPSDDGCPTIGTNSWDIFNGCPDELVVNDGDGNRILCDSACTKFGDDQYCCQGDYNNPDTCGPTNYSEYFKNLCPSAYSYPYDDATSTFTCNGADYTVSFC